MSCLNHPRGQILFELIISILIVTILTTGMIIFIVIQDYEFSFQLGNIVLLYFSSSSLSLFYRARQLRYITQEQLIKQKTLIRILYCLQILSFIVFIIIITYCLVELLAPIHLWESFNTIILKNNFSGNASFFIIFFPIHLYYLMVSNKLRKLIYGSQNLNNEINSLLIQSQQNQQLQSQGVVKTASVLSEEIPNEIKYDSTCSICQEDIFNEKIVSFDCQHIFHSQCIRSWLKTKKNTCPNCRSSITIPRKQSNLTTFVYQSQLDQEIQSIQNQP